MSLLVITKVSRVPVDDEATCGKDLPASSLIATIWALVSLILSRLLLKRVRRGRRVAKEAQVMADVSSAKDQRTGSKLDHVGSGKSVRNLILKADIATVLEIIDHSQTSNWQVRLIRWEEQLTRSRR